MKKTLQKLSGKTISYVLKQLALTSEDKSVFAPNKKAGLTNTTLTKSYSAIRLSLMRESVTFCPYFTIGLAFLSFRAWAHNINKISTEETSKE